MTTLTSHKFGELVKTFTLTWVAIVQRQHLPSAVQRLLDPRTFEHLNVTSSLVATAVTVMLIATAPEEFGLPECADTVEAAGLKGLHRWGVA